CTPPSRTPAARSLTTKPSMKWSPETISARRGTSLPTTPSYTQDTQFDGQEIELDPSTERSVLASLRRNVDRGMSCPIATARDLASGRRHRQMSDMGALERTRADRECRSRTTLDSSARPSG